MSNVPWIDIAESHIGLKEIPGDDDNPEIMQWAKELEQKYYTADSIPWCGLFAAHCLNEAGVNVKKIGNFLWALNYRNLGVHCEPTFGAVMVFSRNGGGHVAFYVKEDDDYYYVLGGNQSDAVNVTRMPKGNLVDSRWPSEFLDLKT